MDILRLFMKKQSVFYSLTRVVIILTAAF
ncbi:uncharacterized protein METZ01_LOCUS218923, partial [marine metagenome]